MGTERFLIQALNYLLIIEQLPEGLFHVTKVAKGEVSLYGQTSSTGFVSVLPLTLIFDLPENTTLHRETTLETSLELLDAAFTTRFEAKRRQ